MKKGLSKICSAIIAFSIIFLTTATPAFAITTIDNNETEKGFGWTESTNTTYNSSRSDREMFVWKLTGSDRVRTDNGTHRLRSYIMWNLNDTRYVKAETDHYKKDGSKSLHGYSRARFESMFGSVHSATDSGRVWGYGESIAVSPEAFAGGVARTYCGDHSTT